MSEPAKCSVCEHLAQSGAFFEEKSYIEVTEIRHIIADFRNAERLALASCKDELPEKHRHDLTARAETFARCALNLEKLLSDA